VRVASYYKYVVVEQEGLGNANYHTDIIGKKLQQLLGEATFVGRMPGADSRDVRQYDILDGDFDINHLQLFDLPHKRPKGFVYTTISDYLRLEPELDRWLNKVRPDVLFPLQHYRQDIINHCERYNCKCVLLPHFLIKKPPYIKEKKITAYMSGAWGMNYPLRTTIARYLKNLNRKDISINMTNDQHNYAFTDKEDHTNLSVSKYVFSGGVYDFQIPPKYFDICNCGACLVSFDMPMMAECGFVDGKTYIKLNSLEDIDQIIASGRWREIAPAGQKMVQGRHMIEKRAEQILRVYNEG